jgi:signal transduction histidine kinase
MPTRPTFAPAESVPDSADAELRKLREELKASQRQLHATQQQLVQTERLRMLGALVQGMAHDLGNSLAHIVGHAELLQLRSREKPIDRTFAASASKIAGSALEAAQIVERFREFHHAPSTHDRSESVSIEKLVAEAVEFTRPRWQSESHARGTPIEIVTDFAEVAPIAGNLSELRDMLTALIFNAIEAMPQGGRIAIRTQLWGRRVEVSLTDAGVGMHDEVRRRCFEPFFTTKAQHNAGLGLAMVYGVVERHSGTIEIESHRGRGTTVRLTLPIHPTPAPRVEAAESRPVKPLHILVVDDEAEQGELLAQMLGHDWHKVDTATDGLEAMRQFEREHFDLVITDKAMPGMNGDQLAVAVKGREPRTKVIMLTGFGSGEESGDEHSEFLDLVVAKPVNGARLRKAIELAFAQS